MPRTLSLGRLAAEIAGERVFVPGSAGEPTALLDHLLADPARTRGLHVLTSFIAGINTLDFGSLDASATVTGLFMQPGFARAEAEGRFRHLPVSFAGFARHIAERAEIDTAILHVAPPDASGRCSLGPTVEFMPIAVARSRRAVALVNPRLPPMPGAASVAYDDLDAVAEADMALRGYEVGPPSRTALAIARNVAPFVADGAALQVGLGKVPDALLSILRDRRGLRLQSGMLADGALDLADCGALDPDFPHVSCVWVGSAALYERLRGRPGFRVAGCDETHDIRRVGAVPGLVAVNSALSVDLFGQANLELAGGRAVSGVGGAADFARAARLSPGGISIVALPAALERDTRSRIVASLDGGVASLPRTDIDVVVTEHGAADLRGLSADERAEALIGVASPPFRDELAASWREARAQQGRGRP